MQIDHASKIIVARRDIKVVDESGTVHTTTLHRIGATQFPEYVQTDIGNGRAMRLKHFNIAIPMPRGVYAQPGTDHVIVLIKEF